MISSSTETTSPSALIERISLESNVSATTVICSPEVMVTDSPDPTHPVVDKIGENTTSYGEVAPIETIS